MTGARPSKPARFVRRSRPEDRVYIIEIPFTDDEFATVEAEAAALRMSVDDYLFMRVMEDTEGKGNA